MQIRKTRSKETFFENLGVKSAALRRSTLQSLKSIESFIEQKNPGGVGAELFEEYVVRMASLASPQDIVDSASDLLQEWVGFMNSRGMSPRTIRLYFSRIKTYLYYRGVRLTSEDVSQINFPANIHEERYPLTYDMIRRILDGASHKKRGLYLALLSSGMRIGEAVQLRKRDLIVDTKRVTVKIRATTTKTRAGRTTYISSEAERELRPRLSKMSDDDLVFASSSSPAASIMAEEKALRECLARIGFDEKYENGMRRRMKITPHSFRAFFFTRAARAHDENYAHKMTGHGGYLMTYDRLTDEEKLDMYISMEPSLLIYDQSRNEEKIRRLQESNKELVDQAEKIRDLESRLRSMEGVLRDAKP